MTSNESLSSRLVSAFDAFFAISNILRNDVSQLFDQLEATESSRRNFLRATGAMFEGMTLALIAVAKTIATHVDVSFSSLQRKLLEDERRLDSSERTRETFKLLFSAFSLPRPPDFSGKSWRNVVDTLEARHRLSHPKSVADLHVDDSTLQACRDAITWLLTWSTSFLEQLQAKYMRGDS